MFEGVYCQEKNSSTVFETILIDNYNDCINSALNPPGENPSDSGSAEMNSASDRSSDPEACTKDLMKPLTKCYVGQDVRATYTVDGKPYEANVLRVFGKPPDIMANVRYHGYGNEETVPVKLIYPSLGPIAIREQITRAKLDNGEEIVSDGSLKKDIKWKKGMACRALYEEKDIIYEATVLEVNEKDQTAYVEMLGYGTCFHAKFKNMYESIPDLKEKQLASALQYINEIRRNKMMNSGGDRLSPEALVTLAACNRARPKENESKSSDSKKEIDVTSDVSKKPKLDNKEIQSSESVTNGVHPKKNESISSDLPKTVDVPSEVLKESELKCINKKEHGSETPASGEASPKENISNCLDSNSKPSEPVDALKETKFDGVNENVQNSETLASDGPHLEKNETNHIDSEREPKLDNTASELTDVLTENFLPLSLISEEIHQPESESEALACLLSANYLSGYYAGYYDCIRRRQNSDKI